MRAILLTIGMVFASLLISASCRPSWYRPAAIDFARLEEDKRRIVGLYDEISAGLNAGRDVLIELSEADLNRWIAARHEFWHDIPALPAGVRDPMVRIRAGGRVDVAITLNWMGWSSIVTVAARPEIAGDARLEIERVWAGMCPVPLSALLGAAPETARSSGQYRIEGSTIMLSNVVHWENGEKLFRIAEFQTRAGWMSVRISPLPAAPR